MSELKEVWSYKGHDGYQKVFRHYSQSLKSEHEFSVYLPPKAILNQKCPVMYWCTGAAADDREFMLKSGVQKYASERNMIVVAPEPRPGPLNDMPKEITAEYFAQFGFYLDATEPPYSENFRMYTYMMEELLPLVDYKFPVLTEKRGIAGHSMGGMASLVFGLRNTDIFQSISCMSPISHPTGMPIGQSLMRSYFGDKREEEGPKYDPSLLIKQYEGPHRHILVDQGGKDELWSLCMTDSLIEAVMMKNLSLTYRSHAGYSHGIETIASFIGDHIAHHADEMGWKG